MDVQPWHRDRDSLRKNQKALLCSKGREQDLHIC